MMRLLVVAAVVTACSKPPPSVPAIEAETTALVVQLPAGWVAVRHEAGLGVGPPGQVVMGLEASTEGQQGSPEALFAAMQASGAQRLSEQRSDDRRFFAGIHRAPDGGQAVVAVRLLERASVRCSTLGFLSPADLNESLGVCRTVQLRGKTGGPVSD